MSDFICLSSISKERVTFFAPSENKNELNEKRCYMYPYKKEEYKRIVPDFPVQNKKTVLITTI